MDARRRNSRVVPGIEKETGIKGSSANGSQDPDINSSEDEKDDASDKLVNSADEHGCETFGQFQNRVDLSRLEAPSLRKYRRLYKLGEVQNGGAKEELIPAVLRHWNQTILDEDETLVSFAFALRKQATSGSGTAPGISRPFVVKGNASRSGTKAKGR